MHVLYDFTYDLYAEIEISSKILDTHLNGFYHIPLEIEVYFYDFLMPNFEISLKFSNNLVTSNEKNENIKLYVNMENLDTDVYYQDIVTYYYVDEDYFDYSTARLLQETSDTTNSDSTTDNTDESSNITTDSEDQNSEDDSTDSSFNVDESEDSTIVKTYRKPVIKKMRKSLDFVNFSISQPSLSQRMVTVGIYLFTLPDDDNDIDVTLTVSARDSVLIQTTQFLSYFSGTAGIFFW